MAGQPGFVLRVAIAAPPERVHAFLADLHNLRALHPLITGIRDLPPRPGWPNARHYEVRDRSPLGPIALRTTYRAAMEAVSATELRAGAWQSPGVELSTRYVLEPSDEGTRLTETVEVRAPRLLRGFVVRQARAAHETTLARLAAVLGERR